MVVGPGEMVSTVTEAARLARDGDVIEIRSGNYRGQTAIWTQNNLLIRGIGKRPVMIADGQSAEDKAIWVVRGGNVRIENIEFRGARVVGRQRRRHPLRDEDDLTVHACVVLSITRWAS